MRVMIGLLMLFVAGQVAAEIMETEVLPALNQPVSNNAVALVIAIPVSEDKLLEEATMPFLA